MENWKEVNQETPEERRWKTVAGTIGAVLLVTLIVAAWVIGSQYSKQKRAASNWQTEMSQLEQAKADLNTNLETLEGEYDTQITENNTLKEDLSVKIAEVEDLEKKVKSAQSQLAKSKANSEEIRSKLTQLEELKSELEQDIARITGENTALSQTNAILTETVASKQQEVEKLTERVTHLTAVNTKLNQRLASIAPAGFTADHFAITAQKRNDKITSKASRADVITVSFDLSDVPQDYARTHDIYLMITDFDGMPVQRVPLKTATVRTADNVMNIQIADQKKVRVDRDQKVEMTIRPEDDLDPGAYNLVVYADNGFLGATGFQLR